MEDPSVINEQDVIKIADMCPRAMFAYFVCVKKSNKFGESSITKKHIVDELGRSWTKFRNDLRTMMSIGVIDVYDVQDGVEVDLLGDGYDSAML